MASLNHIINNDEEPVNSQSGSRSLQPTLSSTLHSDVASITSSFISSTDRISSPSLADYNTLDTPRPHTTPATARVLPSSPKPGSSARRPSHTSIESMETYHRYERDSLSPIPTMAPSRPSDTEVDQVRLTPVTKRVSKAKKGVRVHHCTDCPKVSHCNHITSYETYD